MIKIGSKLLIGAMALMAFGCSDEKFEEINTNPNQPDKITLEVGLPAGVSGALQNFGFGYDRYSGAFTQHFAGNHATGVELDQYDFDAGYFNFEFDEMYRDGLFELKNVITLAEENGSAHYAAAAKITTAVSLGYLTDVYGDIPWSEAFGGSAHPYPVYDSQEHIYQEIQRLLSEAITDLDEASTISLDLGDITYGGNTDRWKAIAHVLKARYANHLSKRDPQGSANEALDNLEKAYALGLNADGDFIFKWDGGSQHQNPWNDLFRNNLIIASENFMAMLLDNNDPRLEAYWDDESDGGTDVGYTGKCNGFGISNESYSPVGPNGFFGKEDSPVLVATFFEAKFIEAEANMRVGKTQEAAAAMNEGVAASIAKVVTNPDGLARVADYIANFGSEDMNSVSMEKIMTEKYKAMFTQNIESWVDVRRHDYAYPSYLTLPLANCTDALNSAPEFVRRGIYPQSELDNNPANVPAEGKGRESKFNRLWWDQ